MTVSVDDIQNELSRRVQTARNFIATDLEENWAKAEKYYQGETDLPLYPNRSQVVKTEVRDAIRNTMPSIMRTLLHSRKIVQYVPNNIFQAAWAEQQSEYVTHLFWASDGYRQLFSAIKDSAKYKYGVLKSFWVEDPRPSFFKYTGVAESLIEQLMSAPNTVIEEIELSGNEDQQGQALFDVSGYNEHPHGKIVIEAVPVYEFFIDQNSTSVADACERGVHGQSRVVTINEAEELGLDYDDWTELDYEDPEESHHGQSQDKKRGFAKRHDTTSVDESRHQFLLTEAYYTCKMEGDDHAKLYRFWLGGTSYKYIDHDEVEESPFDICSLDLESHTPFPMSLFDITKREQDAGTSALRAALDNAHAANNPRYAANPQKTSFEDLTNHALNTPVRTIEQIQAISIPFTGQGLMQILGYLDMDTQSKVGVTKAAQGLDPDALQSTDKNAVMNTIQTSQGQVELMVRNVVETCLIPQFQKLLKLATRHFNPNQVMLTKGAVIPVSLEFFHPSLVARPNVGLGTANDMQKAQGLMFVYEQQKEFMATMGENNPFTSLSQIYNTLEDLGELMGVHDVGRYFKLVTPEIEAKIAEAKAQAAAEQEKKAPADPAKMMAMIEQGKRQIEMMELELKRELETRKLQGDAVIKEAELELDRDRIDSTNYIKLVELGAQAELANLKKETEGNDVRPNTGQRSGSGQTASAQSRPANGGETRYEFTSNRSNGNARPRGNQGTPS